MTEYIVTMTSKRTGIKWVVYQWAETKREAIAICRKHLDGPAVWFNAR